MDDLLSEEGLFNERGENSGKKMEHNGTANSIWRENS